MKTLLQHSYGIGSGSRDVCAGRRTVFIRGRFRNTPAELHDLSWAGECSACSFSRSATRTLS